MAYYRRADEIRDELLSYMSDEYAKEKGYWLWEILKACACGISDLTDMLESAANKLYAEKCSGDELDDYVENWSYIKRKAATRATGWVSFTAGDEGGTVPAGTYVTNGTVNYITAQDIYIPPGETVSTDATAAVYGSVGNCEAKSINKAVTSIEFVKAVTNESAFTGGEDYEDDESLRERYYEAMRKRANAGNRAYYEELAKECDGVGQAYCVPCPNDVPGTADIYVVNMDGGNVAEGVIESVQAYIDPNRNGDGEGKAPIGAKVTVKDPEKCDVDIDCTTVLYEGYEAKDVEAEIRKRLEEYMREAFDERILRYNRVGKCILECDGVKDYTELKVNGKEENIDTEDNIYIYTLRELNLK